MDLNFWTCFQRKPSLWLFLIHNIGVCSKSYHMENEGKDRSRRRCALKQMSEKAIRHFVLDINRVLTPSGYLFLWAGKFHLCQDGRP